MTVNRRPARASFYLGQVHARYRSGTHEVHGLRELDWDYRSVRVW